MSECALQPSFHFSRSIVFALELQDTRSEGEEPRVHSVAPKTLKKLTAVVPNRSELVLCVADCVISICFLVCFTFGTHIWFPLVSVLVLSVILKNIVCMLLTTLN